MNIQVYYVMHVLSVILLTAFTFKAFAAPQPEKKGKVMMVTGICSLLALIGGFGLLAKLNYDLASGWVIIKLVAWLGLAGLSGMAYRQPNKTGFFSLIATLLLAAAVYAVYFKPF